MNSSTNWTHQQNYKIGNSAQGIFIYKLKQNLLQQFPKRDSQFLNISKMFSKIAVIFPFILQLAICSDTGDEDSHKHYANACFSPKPLTSNMQWAKSKQPDGGFFVPASNDISRLHFTENLRGKNLTLHDNFNDPCFRVKAMAMEDKLDVQLFGYGSLTFHWVCTASKDYVGLKICYEKSETPTEFHENFNVYHSFSDDSNFSVLIYCFPNGQVGWTAFSVTPTLTDEEMKAISDHVKSLGFSDDTTVMGFTDSCPNK